MSIIKDKDLEKRIVKVLAHLDASGIIEYVVEYAENGRPIVSVMLTEKGLQWAKENGHDPTTIRNWRW
jgi:DNA-binding PadR family transcriptional regulator